MKTKIILIPVIPVLFALSACTQTSHLQAVTGKEDSPSITKAEIEFTGSEGVLNVDYLPGVVWPKIQTEVKVALEIGGIYSITRKDGVKYQLLPVQTASKVFICPDCATAKNEYNLPLKWILK